MVEGEYIPYGRPDSGEWFGVRSAGQSPALRCGGWHRAQDRLDLAVQRFAFGIGAQPSTCGLLESALITPALVQTQPAGRRALWSAVKTHAAGRDLPGAPGEPALGQRRVGLGDLHTAALTYGSTQGKHRRRIVGCQHVFQQRSRLHLTQWLLQIEEGLRNPCRQIAALCRLHIQ